MTVEKYSLKANTRIRRIEDPISTACFRGVTRIWHFPTGDVLLERDEYRDCLVPAIDRIDLSVSDCHRVGEAVVLSTETTVEVTEEQGDQILTEIDEKLKAGL